MHKIKIPQPAIDRVLARRDQLHVFREIDPRRTAHVVVDLQNGFMVEGQPVEIPTAREIVPNVNRISHALRAAGGQVVYIQSVIDEKAQRNGSNWFSVMSGAKRVKRMEETFCEGSFGHQLYNELEVLPADLRVTKRTYSAFTPGMCDLHSVLQQRGIDTLLITGTATNVCCESTARDAMMMNYKVIFITDGNATWTDEEHNATLGTMLAQFSDVRSTDEVIHLLSGSQRAAAE